jgi:hypothetical protein
MKTTHGDLPAWVERANMSLNGDIRKWNPRAADRLADCLAVLTSRLAPFPCTYQTISDSYRHFAAISITVWDGQGNDLLKAICAIDDAYGVRFELNGQPVYYGRSHLVGFADLILVHIHWPWVREVYRALDHSERRAVREDIRPHVDALVKVLCFGRVTLPNVVKFDQHIHPPAMDSMLQLWFHLVVADEHKILVIKVRSTTIEVRLEGEGWVRYIAEPTSNNMARGLADLAALLEEDPRDSHSLW